MPAQHAERFHQHIGILGSRQTIGQHVNHDEVNRIVGDERSGVGTFPDSLAERPIAGKINGSDLGNELVETAGVNPKVGGVGHNRRHRIVPGT